MTHDGTDLRFSQNYSPIPKRACGRCGKQAPGAKGGKVSICSPKQYFDYKYIFCEACMDELHPQLGKLIGEFVTAYPRDRFQSNYMESLQPRIPEYGFVTDDGKTLTLGYIVRLIPRMFGWM